MRILSGKGGNSVPSEISSENFVIFTAVTVAYTGFSSSFPFLAIFLMDVRGVPLASVGIVYLASGFLGIAGQIIGGRLSDFGGTKTMTVLGLTASVAFYLLIALFVAKDSPVYFFMIAYPLLSLFNNLSQLALSSHISDRKKDQMASGMSLLYAGVNLGFTIGPVTGGLLISYYGYMSIFLFGAISTIGSALVALLKIKTNPRYGLRATGNGFTFKLEKGLLPFFFLVMISWIAIGYQAIPLSVFEAKFLSLSSIQIGVVLTTNGLLITLLQIPVSNLIGIERKLRLLPIALGSALMAAGLVAIGFSTGFMTLEVAIIFTTLGEIMVAVPTQVVATMFSKDHNRGVYQGYYFAFSRVGISLSSYIGPLIFGIFAFEAAIGWYIIAAATIATAVAYYALSPVLEREYVRISSNADRA